MARAYDRAAVERIGEFARLNFPEEWPPQRRAEVRAGRREPDGEVKRKRAKVRRPDCRTSKTKRTVKQPLRKARRKPRARSR
jgi:hypothetical protein